VADKAEEVCAEKPYHSAGLAILGSRGIPDGPTAFLYGHRADSKKFV